MPFDPTLAERIRAMLELESPFEEKKMFGGLCFMVNGHMCCGVLKSDMVARVGPDGTDEALAQPHARPMDFTGRSMKGLVYVGPAGTRSDTDLRTWIQRALHFVQTQPAKVG